MILPQVHLRNGETATGLRVPPPSPGEPDYILSSAPWGDRTHHRLVCERRPWRRRRARHNTVYERTKQNKTSVCRVVSCRFGSVSLVRLVRTWLRMAPRAPDVFTTPEGVTLAARAFRPQRLVVRRRQSTARRRTTVGVSPQFGGVATRGCFAACPGSLAFQTRLCLASERESALSVKSLPLSSVESRGSPFRAAKASVGVPARGIASEPCYDFSFL